ncbi:zinc-ribbon domain-containing protein [Nitrosopumilus sp.]|uniref:zinc ribbon domain-containing protein n=1 Tax=Nitrosopumilus sp. TaxID=2024843 RepID=UPI00349FE34D
MKDIMDPIDVVDDVNALLKLGVGDSYRLEHIKQAYIQNKTIWVTDENYLKRMREKYLIKHTFDTSEDTVFENEPEPKETIHCWKCGKKCPLGANFCMTCGTSLFEVGANPQPVPKSKSFTTIPLKIPMLVGIPVIILIILGAGYTQGYFDNMLDDSSSDVSNVVPVDDVFIGIADSRCGPGTVLDTETDSCVVGIVAKNIETNSKCGPGLVYDPDTNSCNLE